MEEEEEEKVSVVDCLVAVIVSAVAVRQQT